jgi:hypothetical protein
MRAVVLIAALFFTTSVSGKDVYLPVAGSVGVFRTDTRLFNPAGTKDIIVTASFLPVGQDNTNAASREI